MKNETKYYLNREASVIKQEDGIYHIFVYGKNNVFLLNNLAFYILQNANGLTKEEIIKFILDYFKEDKTEPEKIAIECNKCLDILINNGLLLIEGEIE